MLNKIPFILIYSRILIAAIIVSIAFIPFQYQAIWIVSLMSFGLLTDVFDGIIARKLNISTQKLRTLDSNVDQVFWIVSIFSIFYLNIDFIKSNVFLIVLIFVLEIVGYLVSYLKFKKSIATHSLLAKFWTLTLLAFLIDLCLNSTSTFFFYTCVVFGVISRIEMILIIASLKKWTTDVPTIFSVFRINRGEAIKRNKWFNG